jgi:predicted ABC-type sugar transport system permease subunit
MSTDTLESGPSLKDAMSDYWSRIKSGDIGALPAVLGLVVLCGVFGFMSNVFLTSSNFANLITQAAAVTVIAMGLIFTLLLGEIDLSAGYASGVCGAILVILITKHGWAWFLAHRRLRTGILNWNTCRATWNPLLRCHPCSVPRIPRSVAPARWRRRNNPNYRPCNLGGGEQ